MTESTRLYLVRHGQTEFNASGRVQGHTESALTERGRDEADRTGRALAGRGIQTLYTSDLGRARETAERIAVCLGLPIRNDPRLREVAFGELEGRTWGELDAYFHRAEREGRGDWFTHVPLGGESRAQMQQRAVATLTELSREHQGETLLVVSHGGFIGFFLRHVLSIHSSTRYVGFRTPNCAIHSFEWREDRFHLTTWGERTHLDQR
jgi:probable phosphoglycerate mutase